MRQIEHHLLRWGLVEDRQGAHRVVNVFTPLARVHLPPQVEHDFKLFLLLCEVLFIGSAILLVRLNLQLVGLDPLLFLLVVTKGLIRHHFLNVEQVDEVGIYFLLRDLFKLVDVAEELSEAHMLLP